MHSALMGALVGAGVGVLFYLADYVMLTAQSNERAKKLHRKPGFDDTERKRLKALSMFCLLLPPAFALAFWVFS